MITNTEQDHYVMDVVVDWWCIWVTRGLLVSWLASYLVKIVITLLTGFVKSKFGSAPQAENVESDGEKNRIHHFWGEEPSPSPENIFIAICCTK